MAKKGERFSKGEFSALKFAWELGYTITIPLVILVLVGRFLDKRFDTSPAFLLVGIFLSIVFSVIGIYRSVKPILSKFEKEDKRTREHKNKRIQELNNKNSDLF